VNEDDVSESDLVRVVLGDANVMYPDALLSSRRLEYIADDLPSMAGRPEVNVTDVYPLVLWCGVHLTVKSVLDRMRCPGACRCGRRGPTARSAGAGAAGRSRRRQQPAFAAVATSLWRRTIS
jgi:hypothetical protein